MLLFIFEISFPFNTVLDGQCLGRGTQRYELKLDARTDLPVERVTRLWTTDLGNPSLEGFRDRPAIHLSGVL